MLLAAAAQLERGQCEAIDRFWQHLPNSETSAFWKARNGIWASHNTGGVRRGRLLAALAAVRGMHPEFTWNETPAFLMLEGAALAQVEADDISAADFAAAMNPWAKACAAIGRPIMLSPDHFKEF
jgi:hypothetical protein